MLRAFCCGLPKAGTSTLHHALEQAGLRSVHGKVGDTPSALLLNRAWLEDADPLLYLPDWVEAITDPYLSGDRKWRGVYLWPSLSPGFLRSLRQHHPDLLIVLHTRQLDGHVASIRRWKDLAKRLRKADLPFLPSGMGGGPELGWWINGYYARVRQLFAGDPQFLEIAIEDPDTPARLAAALGVDMPWWGAINANPIEG